MSHFLRNDNGFSLATVVLMIITVVILGVFEYTILDWELYKSPWYLIAAFVTPILMGVFAVVAFFAWQDLEYD